MRCVNNSQEAKLKNLIMEDEKKRWKRIGALLGKSDITCRKKAQEWGFTK